ncbi:DUF6318 family protein [Cellulosimicrobium protaetiae]|uniref:DUF6318 domain-containing protein n=1 Tax=Cellulosimicrobium protaetiae TaxID=2587808 RepID=A0A6M5UE54_9MICO|nr:DUF6318 family protein [Cellulosimicrobium protaetiae]QJW35503.1 hypothetical protein FIC82_004090 [Cellulosimicrobium protaetiae]
MAAACSGSTEPDPTPIETSAEPSPTETPEPSPTETGPVKPERPTAMDRDDAEGAAAAAEYFLELYPYIMTSSDTAEWEAMSHQECGYCSESLANARWLSDSGSVFTGGETTVEILTSYARDSQTGIFPLDVRTHQEPIEVSDATGQSVETVPRDTVELRIEMGRNTGSWVVVEVAPMPKDEG